jgi:hypothetical protein
MDPLPQQNIFSLLKYKRQNANPRQLLMAIRDNGAIMLVNFAAKIV